MGARTAASIISEALLEAGDTSLSTRALVWLNDWLRSQYAAWAWPNLKVRATAISLASGATSLTLGAGSGGVTNGIHRIFPPISIYRSDRTAAGKALIRPAVGDMDETRDETIVNPASFIGIPTEFRYRKTTTDGQLQLIPLPFPDRDYLLAFDYQQRPANIISSQTPAYENDETIVQAVVWKALRHMHGPSSREAVAAYELLRVQQAEDRVKYGNIPGDNESVDLDPSTFR